MVTKKIEYTKQECKEAVYLLKNAKLLTETESIRMIRLIKESQILYD